MMSKPSSTNNPKTFVKTLNKTIENLFFPVVINIFVKSLNKAKKHSKVPGIKLRTEDFQATLATGFHLFPFRTEKLSPSAPMVLQF